MRNIVPSLTTLALLALVANAALAEDAPRQVNVSGNASVSAAPDRATVNLGIQARNPSLGAARDRVARVAGEFLALCRNLGIAEKNVQTTALNMRPEYRWDRDAGEQEFIGYFVQRSLTVELDDLDLLGQLIEGAVDVGVNEVSPPQLDSSRRRELHRQALALAAEDARANAEALATTLGAQLGAVRQINAGDVARPPQPVMLRAQMAEAADAAATYQAGDIRFDARVNVSFDLE
jgi:uncharacterized protein YggE